MNNKLPPGSQGFPVFGETRAFLADTFKFIKDRVAKHGPVFKSHVLGGPAIFMSGAAAWEKWLDNEFIIRDQPKPMKTLFGGQVGRSLPMLNGEEHIMRKKFMLEAYNYDALGMYVPGLERIINNSISNWIKKRELSLVPELKLMSMEAILNSIVEISKEEVIPLFKIYDTIGLGFRSIPIAIPGTNYSKALKALDEVLEFWKKKIIEYKQTQALNNGHRVKNDALTLLLAGQARHATAVSIDELRAELHHMPIAGKNTWCLLVKAILMLEKNAKIRKQLDEEIKAHAGSLPLTIETLRKMPYLLRFTKEVTRHTPALPTAGMPGKVKKSFELYGYTIPVGSQVYVALEINNSSGEFYSNPTEFDPDRFSEARAEDKKHPCAYAPLGTGAVDETHRCLGEEFTYLFTQVFIVEFMRRCRWELPPQDLSYFKWNRIPEPRDGLKVKFFN